MKPRFNDLYIHGLPLGPSCCSTLGDVLETSPVVSCTCFSAIVLCCVDGGGGEIEMLQGRVDFFGCGGRPEC